jgi:hypothetical protein
VHDELRNAIQRAGMELPTPHPDLQQVQRGGKRTLVVRRSGAVVLVVALLVSLFALYPRFISDGKPSEVSVGPSGPENMPLQTDDVVSLNPNRLSVGDRAQLRVTRSIGVWGLAWHLERQEGLSWEWIGGLVAGPGNQWKTRFYLGPGAANIGVDDVGFTQTASIAVRVPQLEPGKYRLGQEFFLEGGGSDESQNQWHYAEFEVVEGQGEKLATCRPNVDVGEITGDGGRHTTKALTPNVQIASGEQQGLDWTWCAYRAIVTVNDEEPEPAFCEEFRYGLGRGSGSACSVGLNATVPIHWHYFLRSSDPTEDEGVAFTGAISERVDKVVLQLDDGSDIEARIYDPPEELGVNYRFFVGFAPQGNDVTVVVLDQDGNELQREAWSALP